MRHRTGWPQIAAVRCGVRQASPSSKRHALAPPMNDSGKNARTSSRLGIIGIDRKNCAARTSRCRREQTVTCWHICCVCQSVGVNAGGNRLRVSTHVEPSGTLNIARHYIRSHESVVEAQALPEEEAFPMPCDGDVPRILRRRLCPARPPHGGTISNGSVRRLICAHHADALYDWRACDYQQRAVVAGRPRDAESRHNRCGGIHERVGCCRPGRLT